MTILHRLEVVFTEHFTDIEVALHTGDNTLLVMIEVTNKDTAWGFLSALSSLIGKSVASYSFGDEGVCIELVRISPDHISSLSTFEEIKTTDDLCEKTHRIMTKYLPDKYQESDITVCPTTE